MIDAIDLARKLDPAVPDLQRRTLGKAVHAGAIGFDRDRCDGLRALVREARVERCDGDARSESLEVDSEIHARQGLIEIVDVEQDVLLRGGECPEIHQMAVAAGLDRNPGARLMPEILRHHRSGAAQEGERAHQHALVAHRHQLGHPGAIGRGEDGNRIAISQPAQIGVFFARSLLAQTRAVHVTFGQCTGRRLDHRCFSRSSGTPAGTKYAEDLPILASRVSNFRSRVKFPVPAVTSARQL